MPPRIQSGAPAATVMSKVQAALEKLSEGQAADWSKDEALDVIFWLRQVFGLAAGILWGFIPMPGLIGFLGFLASNLGLFMMLYKNVMGLEDDEWEDAGQELMGEGLPYSMSIFMVCWVISYTTFHA